MAFINPYIPKMGEHPGRLFPWSDPEKERLDLNVLLSSAKRIAVELGSGSGGHILERARLEPDTTWVGFEIRYKRSVRTLEKANRLEIPNVYVIRTDGRKLDDFFPDGSVEKLYINFPDPWEKLRVRKHRMLNANVLESAAKILAPGGILSVKTDHANYFKDFLADTAATSAFQTEAVSEDLHASEHATGNVLTEFERLFLSKGLPIHYLRMRRN